MKQTIWNQGREVGKMHVQDEGGDIIPEHQRFAFRSALDLPISAMVSMCETGFKDGYPIE